MHSNITIVHIDGRDGDHVSAQMALLHSQQKLPGSRALMISPHRPKVCLGEFEHVTIGKLGYFDYTLFVIYALHNFIETDFALIVQDDGWILNEASFDPAFLEYDYIGAPTHLARRDVDGTQQYHSNYRWSVDNAIPHSELKILMNGGFSLRSKALLEAPSKFQMKFDLPPPTLNKKNQLFWTNYEQLEDVQLCINMRDQLEQYGLTFAPPLVARAFSFEHLDAFVHGDMDIIKIFGHHSRYRRLVSLNPLTIQYTVKENLARSINNEPFVIDLFQRLNYRVTFGEGTE